MNTNDHRDDQQNLSRREAMRRGIQGAAGVAVAGSLGSRIFAAEAEKKRKYIESYIPHIGFALQDILTLTDNQRDKAIELCEELGSTYPELALLCSR